MTANSPGIERLLNEASFVDALARALAGQDADEVVQRTWLQALQGDAASIRGPRDWLACVVRGIAHNLRRTSARRLAHERAAARRDVVPSSTELIGRQESRRALMQAVDALPQPQRVVVLLRYFEGLPPRRIAAHLGLPVTTVTSRLRTAIAALKNRLDERHGDSRAWLLPFLPPQTASAAMATYAVAMMTKARLVAAAVVLAVLSLVVLDALFGSLATRPTEPGRPSPLTADLASERGASDSGSDPASDRHAVAMPDPTPAPTTGTLLVEVVREADSTPVPDLLVVARRWAGDSSFCQRRVRTDSDGTARIEGLALGWWRVSNAVNSNVTANAELVAGVEAKLRLVLPAGIELRGIVVDEHELPVAGAQVWLKFPVDLDAEHVATTDPVGRFAIHDCQGAVAVGARAHGHAPAPMQRLIRDSGVVELRLVLPGPGGEVAGLVFGPDGSRVADAIVLVGTGLPNRGEDMPARVRTDADGVFHAIGMAPGEHPIRVRADGMAPWGGTCTVQAHLTTQVQVRLVRGLSCTGVVVDAADTPVAGASVVSGDPDDFAYYSTRSARDGSFRLDGLSAGEHEIRASRDGGTAAASVRGGSGDTVACALRLDAGLVLRVRLVDESDAPVADAVVRVEGDRSDGRRKGLWLESSDADGRFTITHCPEHGSLSFAIRGSGIVDQRVENIDPHAGEIEIRLRAAPPPSVFIRGTLIAHDGLGVAHARVTAYGPDSDRWGADVETAESGVFELGPLVPGAWLVSIDAEQHPDVATERRHVAAQGVWDLGTIQLPEGGTVRVRLVERGDLEPRLAVGNATLTRWAAVLGAGDERCSEPIAPGPHFVSVRGEGVASQLVPVEVRAGAQTELELRIEKGLQQGFRFDAPAVLGELRIRVQRGNALLVEERYRASVDRPVPTEWRRWLAPGEYAITATGDGWSGRAPFEVREAGAEPVRVVMR